MQETTIVIKIELIISPSSPPRPRRGVFHALSCSSALPRAPDKQFPYLGCFPQQNEAAVFRHFPAEPIASSGAVMDQKRVRSLCQGARRIMHCPSPPDPAGSNRTARRWCSPARRPAGGASPRWAFFPCHPPPACGRIMSQEGSGRLGKL